MKREVFQAIYILVFLITGISIVGSLELETVIATHVLVLHIISAFLTVGKIIYWIKNKELL